MCNQISSIKVGKRFSSETSKGFNYKIDKIIFEIKDFPGIYRDYKSWRLELRVKVDHICILIVGMRTRDYSKAGLHVHLQTDSRNLPGRGSYSLLCGLCYYMTLVKKLLYPG